MKKFAVLVCVTMLVTFAIAQQENPPVEPMDQTPVFRVNVVSRTTKAVNYRHRGGSTTVDIKGTSLMPEVTGNKVMGAISPGMGVLILSVLQQSQQVTELTETHRGETAVQLGHACTCLFLVVYKIALAICDNVLVGPLNTVAIRGES